MAEVKNPSEVALRGDLDRGSFQSGVANGWWRLVEVAFPHVIIVIAAAPRPAAPAEYALRFECTGYPGPPTAQPWDASRSAPLSDPDWPGGRGRVQASFRIDWQGGGCLYLPCDRVSRIDHDAWATQHPSMIWSPSIGITQYLRIVHDLLQSDDYTGVRGG